MQWHRRAGDVAVGEAPKDDAVGQRLDRSEHDLEYRVVRSDGNRFVEGEVQRRRFRDAHTFKCGQQLPHLRQLGIGSVQRCQFGSSRFEHDARIDQVPGGHFAAADQQLGARTVVGGPVRWTKLPRPA